MMRCLSILAVAAVAWSLAACDAAPNTKSIAELNDLYQKIEPGMAEADLKTVAGEPTKKEPKDDATEWLYSEAGLNTSFLSVLVREGAVVKVTLRDRTNSSQETLTKPAE